MLRQILKFKEAIFYSVVIFSAFVWFLMQIFPQIQDLIRTEKNIKKRTAELARLTAKLEKIKQDAISNRRDEEDRVKSIYRSDIKFENGDTEYLLMIDDIIGMIRDNGLKVYSIDYNYDPSSDVIVSQSGGKYLGCQLTISLIGSYSQIKNLIIDCIKYPYLIMLNSVETEPYHKDKNVLLSVVKLTIYSEQ